MFETKFQFFYKSFQNLDDKKNAPLFVGPFLNLKCVYLLEGQFQ